MLSALIGLEREWRQKAAGLRTQTLVGVAAGLPLPALAVTAGHFIVAFLFPSLAALLPRSRYLSFGVRILYEDGRGILRDVLSEATQLGFAVVRVRTDQLSPRDPRHLGDRALARGARPAAN